LAFFSSFVGTSVGFFAWLVFIIFLFFFFFCSVDPCFLSVPSPTSVYHINTTTITITHNQYHSPRRTPAPHAYMYRPQPPSAPPHARAAYSGLIAPLIYLPTYLPMSPIRIRIIRFCHTLCLFFLSTFIRLSIPPLLLLFFFSSAYSTPPTPILSASAKKKKYRQLSTYPLSGILSYFPITASESYIYLFSRALPPHSRPRESVLD
jgi:hypothetical protein